MVSRGFSWQVPELKDLPAQFFVDLKDGVGAGSTVASGSAKRTGIDNQGVAHPVANGSVGMAIYYTVRHGKDLPQSVFDLSTAENVAVDEAYGKISEFE